LFFAVFENGVCLGAEGDVYRGALGWKGKFWIYTLFIRHGQRVVEGRLGSNQGTGFAVGWGGGLEKQAG